MSYADRARQEPITKANTAAPFQQDQICLQIFQIMQEMRGSMDPWVLPPVLPATVQAPIVASVVALVTQPQEATALGI